MLPDVHGLDKAFDYLVGDLPREQVLPGSVVRVDLSGRRVAGWVLGTGPAPEELPVDRLRPIRAWVGHGPPPDMVDLARWAALRWGSDRLRPLLVAASPHRRVPRLGTPRRHPPGALPGASAGVRTLLGDGGGVVRESPGDDHVGTVLAAAELGPTIVVLAGDVERHVLVGRLRHTAPQLSVAVLPDDWAAAAAGTDVVVGGRSAVFAPVPGLAAVVVLDEHDEALQEERAPTWHARDVAVERARRAGVPCVLAAPCPTVTALAWSGRRWMRPPRSVERDGWPLVDVVDRRADEGQVPGGRRSLVTSQLVAALRDHSRTVVCVHNVPGRSRLLACRSCRSVLVCERCEAAVAQVADGALRCGRCSTVRPPVCQSCGSSALANVRPGVARLREELAAAAGRPVQLVTGASEAEASPDATTGTVFVGTEAVLHRVREADVVAFLDLDAELFAPRYRAGEQAFALLVRAARLLGPRSRGGRLLVHTSVPEHPAVQAALLADPGRLARAEAARRRDLALPPFGALARVSGPGAAEVVAAAVAAAPPGALATADDADGLLVRAGSWDELGPHLATAPRPRGARVRVEVDPRR